MINRTAPTERALYDRLTALVGDTMHDPATPLNPGLMMFLNDLMDEMRVWANAYDDAQLKAYFAKKKDGGNDNG